MKEIDKIKKLHKISAVLLTEKKLEKVLDAIVRNAAGFFSSDASSILLFDDKKEYLRTPLHNTEYVGDRILSLPLFPDMADRDVVRVIDTLESILG